LRDSRTRGRPASNGARMDQACAGSGSGEMSLAGSDRVSKGHASPAAALTDQAGGGYSQ
jgi:hypothetical protein